MPIKRAKPRKRMRGETVRDPDLEPDWEPLRNVVDPYIAEHFMWMFAVDLTDGTRLHAYKHHWTRRYLHLSPLGEAFFYIWNGERPLRPARYQRLRLSDALRAVLGHPMWPEHERMMSMVARIDERIELEVLQQEEAAGA